MIQKLSLKQLIHKILQADKRLWDKNSQELNHILLLDLIEKTDANIMGLLLSNPTTKNKFFLQVNNALVFKSNDFRFFIEEHKLNNSYTQFKNIIGLSDGRRFLKDTNDVVLNFPYKDCVLEGGQSTEEGWDNYYEYDQTITKTQENKGYKAKEYNKKISKRKEIFFNQIIAADEIDRLFDPKALVNWQKGLLKMAKSK